MYLTDYIEFEELLEHAVDSLLREKEELNRTEQGVVDFVKNNLKESFLDSDDCDVYDSNCKVLIVFNYESEDEFDDGITQYHTVYIRYDLDREEFTDFVDYIGE